MQKHADRGARNCLLFLKTKPITEETMNTVDKKKYAMPFIVLYAMYFLCIMHFILSMPIE